MNFSGQGSGDPTANPESADAARDRRRKDPAWQQIRVERAIANSSMGRFEPRIVLDAFWGLAGWALVGVAGVAGWVPYWISVPIASVFVFTLYMPMHEATHGNVQGRHRNLRWLNNTVGHLSSIPLGVGFRAHQISHMKHHAFTNVIGKDPDLIYAGSFWRVFARTAFDFTLGYGILLATWLPPLRRRILVAAENTSGKEQARIDLDILLEDRGFQTLTFVLMLAVALAGYPIEVLMFWLIPARVGDIMVALVFAWLPHHPHNAHGRYTNTRVTLFPGSGFIGRGHDQHIIHHMLPLVPHYRIPAVFSKLRPILEKRGTRIEGPGAGPEAPKIVLNWDDEKVAAIAQNAALADARPFI